MGPTESTSRRLLGICIAVAIVTMATGQRENVNDLVVCEDSGIKDITCGNGEVINALSAFWGRGNNVDVCPHVTATGAETCQQNNTYQIFREMCDGRTQCVFDTEAKVWGEECPGVHKLLSLQYSCKDCVNNYDDYKCEEWALSGECGSNVEWMSKNCKRTCERCSDWKPDIVNLHGNDTECDSWASRGFCVSNYVFMISNCRQSCTASKEAADCSTNRHDDLINQRDCSRWASEGHCQINIHYMFWDCTKSCFGCQNDDYIRCENKAGDEVCDAIFAAGNCSSDPGYAIPNCLKSCTGCSQDPVCVNYNNDTACDIWEQAGECDGENAAWMHTNCWKSCMRCDGDENTLTDCSVNKWDRDRDANNCDAKFKQGECSADKNAGMLYNCTKSCFGCEEDKGLRCVNKAGDEQCQQWADAGECDTNPGYMIPMCMKICLRCTTDPVCKNKESNSACQLWANDGECDKNPSWMHANCLQSCIRCNGDRHCENIASNYDCEYWMRHNGCGVNNYVNMMESCTGSCTRCDPEINGIPAITNWLSECRDLFPARDCAYWYSNGDCPKNPTWLQHYCRKSCTHCDQLGQTTTTAPTDTTTPFETSTTATSTTTTTTEPPVTTTTTTTQAPTTTTRSTTTIGATTTTTTTQPPITTRSTTTTTTTTTPRPDTTTTSRTTTTTFPTTTTTTTPRTTTTTTPRPTTTTTPRTTTTTTPRTTTTTTRRTTTTTTTEATTPDQGRTQIPSDGVIGFGANLTHHVDWRSQVNAFTRKKSFILPMSMPASGTLNRFMVRLVSDATVDLEIWRVNSTTRFQTSKYFERVYTQTVTYGASMNSPFVGPVDVDECIEVKEGDILGFTSYRSPSPIDYRRNHKIKDRTYFRASDSERGGFLSMFYTFEFGIAAEITAGGLC